MHVAADARPAIDPVTLALPTHPWSVVALCCWRVSLCPLTRKGRLVRGMGDMTCGINFLRWIYFAPTTIAKLGNNDFRTLDLLNPASFMAAAKSV